MTDDGTWTRVKGEKSYRITVSKQVTEPPTKPRVREVVANVCHCCDPPKAFTQRPNFTKHVKDKHPGEVTRVGGGGKIGHRLILSDRVTGKIASASGRSDSVEVPTPKDDEKKNTKKKKLYGDKGKE